MYRLMITQFLRTRTCQLGLTLIVALGLISIFIGKQFLDDQETMMEQVVEKQEEHIKRNIEFHGDDLGLLVYYLKFSLVNKQNSLAGLSIGQSDLNPRILSVKLLTLEGQKYDTDLVNPTKLLYGNLDLSFILVYIFPLLIIAFMYNLISEEEESGTWQMVRVTVNSKMKFIVSKLMVRLVLLLVIMLLLCVIASVMLNIHWGEAFFTFLIIGLLYQVFWFALSFSVILLRRNSRFNAVVLLSCWLLLLILLPAVVNNAVTNRYPVPEAFTTFIKQRDGYHEKWDLGKKETVAQFYKSYPQFEKFGFPPEEGFNWLWYYAMQHLGDEESRSESKAMHDKISKRQEMSRKIALFVPSMHTLLTFNELAETSLSNHIDFLQYANTFHENIRLYFYPKVFSEATSDAIDWERFKPEHYQPEQKSSGLLKHIGPLLLGILIFIGLSAFIFTRHETA